MAADLNETLWIIPRGTSPAIVLFDLDEKRLLCPHFADEEVEVERGKDRNLFALMANQTLFAYWIPFHPSRLR